MYESSPMCLTKISHRSTQNVGADGADGAAAADDDGDDDDDDNDA